MRPRFLAACCVLCVCCFWAALLLAGSASGQPGRTPSGNPPPPADLQPQRGRPAQRGDAAPSGRRAWEYRVLHRADVEELAPQGKDRFTAGLNRLGAEGWELAAIEPPLTYLFKRPVATPPAANRGQRGGGPAADRRPAAAAPAPAAPELRVFQLKHASARDLATTLAKLFPDGGPRGPARFVSDSRTNSVLAFGPTVELEMAEAVLSRLDTPDEKKPAGGK
jgi:hypothetical protein